MKFVEIKETTVENAIEKGLRTLNKPREDVEIEIIEENTKGFLGFGKKPAVVKLTVKYNLVHEIKTFLKELTLGMNVSAEITVVETSRQMEVELAGENMGVLIGKRGHTLEAIQTLTNMVINKGERPYVNIEIDIENYKQKRRENLEALAHSIARRVRETNQSITLEPMSVADRRIIHQVLDKEKGVKTKSSGNEPYRYVVIVPKK